MVRQRGNVKAVEVDLLFSCPLIDQTFMRWKKSNLCFYRFMWILEVPILLVYYSLLLSISKI